MDDNNFFSINRLVEFGMGMAVAQQMVKTMNETMTNKYVHESMNPIEKSQQKFFYAMIEGYQAGPFSEQELTRLIADKKIVKETYLWMPGLSNWKLTEQIPEVLRLVALTPPPFNQK